MDTWVFHIWSKSQTRLKMDYMFPDQSDHSSPQWWSKTPRSRTGLCSVFSNCCCRKVNKVRNCVYRKYDCIRINCLQWYHWWPSCIVGNVTSRFWKARDVAGFILNSLLPFLKPLDWTPRFSLQHRLRRQRGEVPPWCLSASPPTLTLKK